MNYNKQFSTKESKWTFISLIIITLCFTVYKLLFLGIPYFWDESWVYGPAVSEMGQQLPSLLPGSIDIDLSRGHPMLFHFLGGIWGNIFGISIISLHSYALCISLVLLLVQYTIIKNQDNQNLAALVIILLITQGLFLAQSAMVLPEVLVSLFALLSIYYFSKDKVILSALFASLCLLTKESGAMLMPAIVSSYIIHNVLNNSFNFKKSLSVLGIFIGACIPYIIFLFIQKYRFGWFLYPNHMDLQIDNAEAFQRQLKAAIGSLLYAQNRIYLTLVSVLILIAKYRNSKIFQAWLIWIALNSFVIFSMPWKSWSSLIIYFALMSSSLLFMSWYSKNKYNKRYKFLISIVVFTLIYLVFTAFNFFSMRYIFVLIPLYTYICARIIYKEISQLWKYVLFIIIALLLLTKGLKRSPISDTTQSYINVGQAQMELFEYLEKNVEKDAIILAPFLVREAIIKKHAGYRTTEEPYINLPWSPKDNQPFYSISSVIEGEYASEDKKVNRVLLLEKEFKKKNAWFRIAKYSAIQQE